MTISFDPESHTYRLDGDVVPSVHDILEGVGIIDNRWYTPGSDDKGKLLHEMIALELEGDLDESSVDEVFQPYLHALRRCVAALGLGALQVETRGVHLFYRYGFTIDCIGETGGQIALIDWKTGTSREPWHAVQLAAYAAGAEQLGYDNPERYAIRLTPKGNYTVKDCRLATADAAWLAALRLWRWKKTRGKVA